MKLKARRKIYLVSTVAGSALNGAGFRAAIHIYTSVTEAEALLTALHPLKKLFPGKNKKEPGGK